MNDAILNKQVHVPIHLCVLVFAFWLFNFGDADASEHKYVSLATAEQEPYVGVNLPNNGYIHELVTAAFSRSGYHFSETFYPFARAKHITKTGGHDGFFPVHYDDSLSADFTFSDPFPGDQIGFLKKKSLKLPPHVLSQPKLPAFLNALTPYRFGLVRGTPFSDVLSQVDYLKKEYVVHDIQNIDKLDLGRLDIAVIDKYTAADLMVNARPHLIGQLEFIPRLLASKPFHIAFSKHSQRDTELKAAFDKGLALLKTEGKLNTILEKHGFFQAKAPESDKQTLVIGAVETDETKVMMQLSEQFEKNNPHIDIQWRMLTENTLRKRLLSDFAISDGQFDVMMIGAYEAQIWAKNQWILPIENLPEHYDLADIVAPVKDSLSFNNKLYALPFYAESTMTFYRQDLFEKAGIKMPQQPHYQDILSFAKRLHNPEKGVYGIGLRGKPGWGQNMAFLSILVNTFGGRWFDDHWQPLIASKAWQQALAFYKNILTHYSHPNSAKNGWYENQKLFEDGKLAMLIDATSFAGRLYNSKNSQVHDVIGYSKAPIANQSIGSKWLWSWALAIPASSKHPEEAKQFITWATSKKYVHSVAKKVGWVAVPPGARRSTYNEKYKQSAPFANFVIKEIESARSSVFKDNTGLYSGVQFVSIPEFPAIGYQVGLIIAKYIEDEISLETALQQSQALTENIMRKAGYYRD